MPSRLEAFVNSPFHLCDRFISEISRRVGGNYKKILHKNKIYYIIIVLLNGVVFPSVQIISKCCFPIVKDSLPIQIPQISLVCGHNFVVQHVLFVESLLSKGPPTWRVWPIYSQQLSIYRYSGSWRKTGLSSRVNLDHSLFWTTTRRTYNKGSHAFKYTH